MSDPTAAPQGAHPTAEQLSAALAEQFPHPWATPTEAEAHWRESLAPELGRLTDAEFAAQYQRNWPVVADESLYLNHLRLLPGGARALTGIRCRGLDPDRPFVDVVAVTPLPEKEAEWAEVARQVAAPYAAFAPRHVRFTVPGPKAASLSLSRLPRTSYWDFVVVGAPIREMNRRARVTHYGRVALRVPESMGFYPRYRAEYDALYASTPLHREYARVESEADLAESLATGLLFEILVDGAWAGVASVYRDSGFGLRGFVVQEMFLGAAYRGQGLGSAAQQHLAQALISPAGEGDVLYGTIHAGNLPALRAAEGAGRQRLAAQLFVGLDSAGS